MKTRFEVWVQLIGNLALLLGLAFVGFQLYQDRQLKRAELVWQLRESWIQTELATLGEEPYKAIVKSALDPKNLTEEEAYILARLHNIGTYDVQRMADMEEMGVFTSRWRDLEGAFPVYFGTELGHRVVNARIRQIDREAVKAYLEGELRLYEEDSFGRWFNEVVLGDREPE